MNENRKLPSRLSTTRVSGNVRRKCVRSDAPADVADFQYFFSSKEFRAGGSPVAFVFGGPPNATGAAATLGP